MKKITKRIREDAIEALHICASRGNSLNTFIGTQWGGPPGSYEDRVRALADAAFEAVPMYADRDQNETIPFIEQYAEAALLLEDGWSPGEPLPPRRS